MRLKFRAWGLIAAGFIFLLVTLVALSLHSQACASRQAARIFGNATYVMGNEYATQLATLMNGVHDEPYLTVEYTGRYAYGDFNGDGLKDAAIILIENNGGQAHWYQLAFLMSDGEKLVHKASQFLDDSAIINSIREKDGKVLIDMFVHQEGDCRAGPTKRVRNLYAYKGPDRWGEVEKSPYQRIYTDSAKAFQEIYKTPVPSRIRETFDHTIHAHENCSEYGCAFMVLDGEKQVGIFTRKFIVVDLGPSDSGGIYATLVFEGALVPFSLEIDDRGGGRYELRKMTELPGLLGDRFIGLLQDSAYQQYWL